MHLLFLLLLAVCVSGHVVYHRIRDRRVFYYAVSPMNYDLMTKDDPRHYSRLITFSPVKCVSTTWSCVATIDGRNSHQFSFSQLTADNTYTLYKFQDERRRFKFQATSSWALENADTIHIVIAQNVTYLSCISYVWECTIEKGPGPQEVKEVWNVDFTFERDLPATKDLENPYYF